MGKNDNQSTVTYFHSPNYGKYYYNKDHPMKPHRLCMTHHLVLAYGLHNFLQVHYPQKALPADMAVFHDAEYVEFLQQITPQESEKQELWEKQAQFNMNVDCPPFEGLFEYCQLYSGASLQAANQLNYGQCDIAINWAGGLHHAKRSMASGFCYINDLNMAIIELLRAYRRVLYLDIDIHHGDGVEEAFFATDRVMSVSFHRYGDGYFPGTGACHDVGYAQGRNYSINVPLKAGIDDQQYIAIFKDVMSMVLDVYQPEAVVMQCGADSLRCDRVGQFNLSIPAHAECVGYMKATGLPLMITGGGGYTKVNVAKCWTFETALLVGEERSVRNKAMPVHAYSTYYSTAKGGKLHELEETKKQTNSNENTSSDLQHLREHVYNILKELTPVPNTKQGIGISAPGLQYFHDHQEKLAQAVTPGQQVQYFLEAGEDAQLFNYAEERLKLVKLHQDGHMTNG